METNGKILRGILLLTVLPGLNSCGAGSNTLTRTITAETLADKYSVSVEAARREFDGKELVVKGYVSDPVSMPIGDKSEGVILLGSEKKPASPRVQCWFSRYESAEFGDVGTARSITVKGIFNGESGIVLKFCKLVHKD
jgi:hypothetical protein